MALNPGVPPKMDSGDTVILLVALLKGLPQLRLRQQKFATPHLVLEPVQLVTSHSTIWESTPVASPSMALNPGVPPKMDSGDIVILLVALLKELPQLSLCLCLRLRLLLRLRLRLRLHLRLHLRLRLRTLPKNLASAV